MNLYVSDYFAAVKIDIIFTWKCVKLVIESMEIIS